MRGEIKKHWNKLKSISKLSDEELSKSYDHLLTRINFINEELIPAKIWSQSEKIVADIDKDDIDFVALTKHLKGALWTGDKILYNGLRKKRFKTVYLTDELLKIRSEQSF